MPIRLKCSCGKALSLKDEFAGKAVKCPGCAKVIRVPAANAGTGAGAEKGGASSASKSDLDDLFAEEGFNRQIASACRACGAEMKAQSVLCTKCGFNKETGAVMEAHKTDGVDVDMGTVQLRQASDSMQRDAELQQRMHSKSGMPWWLLLVVLFVIISATGLLVAVINSRNQIDGETLGIDAKKTFFGLVAGLLIMLGVGGLLNVGYRYYKKQTYGNIKTMILSILALGIGGYLTTLAR